MKVLFIITALLLVCTNVFAAESCPRLARELLRLRQEYHGLAVLAAEKKEKIEFERLGETLDKIIRVKSQMTKSECRIPERKKPQTTGGERK